MLNVEQIESACESAQMIKLPKHEIEPPELLFEETFYPFGFPAVVKTNARSVLNQFREIWDRFKKQHNTEPIRIDAQLVTSDSIECPPEPTYRVMMPLLMAVADSHNYIMVDLDHCYANLVISEAAIRYPLYAQYFLLGMPVCCVATTLATPIHAACVALEGQGVLLCGDSGAGKSTLSFACARQGWTYVSDDAVYLLNGGAERVVTGDCYKVRLRPAASEFFPEVHGLDITPRAAGKPSIELPTHTLPHIACSQNAHVDFIVFLNRRQGNPQELVPYRKDVAKQFMRQTLYGSPIIRAQQYAAIDRLLATEVFELRYSCIDWAAHRLRTLIDRGR